jgi:uncharacterized protein (UPF0332 family)
MKATSLATALLKQAEHLANKEPKKPEQASLRRAVSAAYYTLFHHIAGTACLLLFSDTQDARLVVHPIALRSFDHGVIKHVSEAFRLNKQGEISSQKYRTLAAICNPVPSDLQALNDFSTAFLSLQTQRHNADYNLQVSFQRPEVQDLIAYARQAVSSINGLKKSNLPLLKLFCVACLLKEQSYLL